MSGAMVCSTPLRPRPWRFREAKSARSAAGRHRGAVGYGCRWNGRAACRLLGRYAPDAGVGVAHADRSARTPGGSPGAGHLDGDGIRPKQPRRPRARSGRAIGAYSRIRNLSPWGARTANSPNQAAAPGEAVVLEGTGLEAPPPRKYSSAASAARWFPYAGEPPARRPTRSPCAFPRVRRKVVSCRCRSAAPVVCRATSSPSPSTAAEDRVRRWKPFPSLRGPAAGPDLSRWRGLSGATWGLPTTSLPTKPARPSPACRRRAVCRPSLPPPPGTCVSQVQAAGDTLPQPNPVLDLLLSGAAEGPLRAGPELAINDGQIQQKIRPVEGVPGVYYSKFSARGPGGAARVLPHFLSPSRLTLSGSGGDAGPFRVALPGPEPLRSRAGFPRSIVRGAPLYVGTRWARTASPSWHSVSSTR